MTWQAPYARPYEANALEVLLPAAGLNLDRRDVEWFYHTLKQRRFDQAGLPPRDLLRRDYKQWDMGGWQVGVVGRCRLTASKPVLKAPMVSALEATI